MDTSDDLLLARRQKLDALVAQGIQPFGSRFPKSQPIHALVEAYQDGASVVTAGRLMAKRGHGAISFADLRDASGKIQFCVRKDRVGEEVYQRWTLLDLGDWIGVEGALFKTRTGEVTIEAERLTLLSKTLRPLPEKWHGLKDVEIRYRQRYLDLAMNEPARRVFEQRAALLDSIRATLRAEHYLEVETPIMQPIAGGAAGEPFVTHHNALDMALYLRLAPELYLKRLLVGGFERVYEMNRCFRNEGLSTRHNPEFTMLEAYCAFEDYRYMMRLVKDLIINAAQATLGTLQFHYQGRAIDLSKEWQVVSFTDLLKNGYDLNPEDGLEAMREKLQKPRPGFKAIAIKGQSRSQLLRLVEELIEPGEKNVPVFVTDHWTEISPLAKSRPDNPLITERFELYLGGFEVANAYSELNDPIEQRRRFEAQLAEGRGAGGGGRGNGPSPLTPHPSPPKQIDEDFLEALEYGMPPATGLGVGIDRLCMLLFDQPSIKDVILFPLQKPPAE